MLNTLVQLDPIYVSFNPGETDLVALEKARRAGTVAVDVTVPGQDTVAHKGGTDLHRQQRRSVHRHRDRESDDRQC